MEKYRSIVLCVDSPDCLRHLALDGARADCGHEAPGGRRARRRVDVGEVILNKVQVRYITSRHVFRGVSCLTDPTLLYTFSCLFCLFLWFCLFTMTVLTLPTFWGWLAAPPPAPPPPPLLVLICHWILLVGSGCGCGGCCCCCCCCCSCICVTDCCWGLDRWPDWRLTLPDIMPGLGLLSGELVKEDTCAKIFGQYTKNIFVR